MTLRVAFEEAQRRWGVNFLRGEGVKVPDDAKLNFYEEVQWSGGCETCGYDAQVIQVSYQRTTKTYYGNFQALLNEILDAGEENDNE